ncbi:hypothetical protein QFC21_000890 [Naganishia friedmannii]|uniref:Uncharacterized protein n=1 Tax=Naganishia friedmannii TaxID=89922 RepID=A0ACC2W6T1_9TREE|nr:hypothetical protein QFC21_000890 [Naganishia friedmannii]
MTADGDKVNYPRPMTRHDTPLVEFPRIDRPITSRIRYATNAIIDADIQPYLGLPARMSLVIMSLPLLSLLLSLSQLLSANRTAQSRADDAKAQILATCKGVEQATNWLGNGGLQRVMAAKVNEGIVISIQGTLQGLRFILIESLNIIEKVIGFVIDMYRSLLMCTLELVVRSVLDLLIKAVDTITDGITTTLNAIRLSIQDDISSANKLIASAVSTINRAANLINVNLSVPKFDIPSLSALQDVKVPSGFEDDLRKLNSSIPSLGELRDMMTELIEMPFEKMKTELNNTLGHLIGNVTVASLPSASHLTIQSDSAGIGICNNMDVSFVDKVAASLAKVARIGTAIVIVGFFLLWIALLAWEWYNWKVMKEQAAYLESRVAQDIHAGGTPNGMIWIQIVEHPVLEKYSEMAFQRFRLKARTRRNLRWFGSYVSHAPALALLCFGLLSLLVVQCQIAAVYALRDDARDDVASGVSESTSSIVAQINAVGMQQSRVYVEQTNQVILGWQRAIDEELFGPWLNTTTVALNSTLEEFYDKVENVLNITFGGTVLATAIKTFMYCILGGKIDNIQTALTWIHDNANVRLPLLDDEALTLPSSASTELALPLAKAAVGSGSEGDGGAIGKIFDAYERELHDQRLIALIFCGLYLVIVVVGILVLLRHTIWPRPEPSDQQETMQEKLLNPPVIRRRQDEQESYFELEDVPLHPGHANTFSQKPTHNVEFLTSAKNKMAQFKSSMMGSRTLMAARPHPTAVSLRAADPFASELDGKMQGPIDTVR